MTLWFSNAPRHRETRQGWGYHSSCHGCSPSGLDPWAGKVGKAHRPTWPPTEGQEQRDGGELLHLLPYLQVPRKTLSGAKKKKKRRILDKRGELESLGPGAWLGWSQTLRSRSSPESVLYAARGGETTYQGADGVIRELWKAQGPVGGQDGV